MQSKHFLRLIFLCVFTLVFLSACSGSSKPSVVILSPASGSEFLDGETIAFQSTATDANGVLRVELVIDNVVIRTDTTPTLQGQPSFTLIQTWKATPGNHTVVVRAYNAAGAVSDPVAVAVSIAAGSAPSSPTTVAAATAVVAPSPTPVIASSSSSSSAASSSSVASVLSSSSSSASGCINNAGFVADVTVPDGTNFAAGQTFNKIWRLSNIGSCTWGVGYQLVFASGTAMTGSTAVSVPATAPGATVDILVPMTAPASAGSFTGVWRMRAPGNIPFGNSVTVKITVVGGAASSSAASSVVSSVSGCVGQPNIASFTASTASIPAAATITVASGTTVTLNWGAVTNADAAEIDQGIDGIETPGSRNVNPTTTTTYTLTAHCGGNTKTAQVKVNIGILAPPIASFTLSALGGGESGTVYEPASGLAVVQGTMLAGDIASNKIARAFMSFDISGLHGRTIDSAKLDLTGCSQSGNPFTGALVGLWVGELEYPTPLAQSAYGLSGTAVTSILTAKPSSTIDVKSFVQTRANQNKDRFQIRVHPSGPTDGDNASDYLLCGSGVPKLTIIAE